MVCMSSHVRSPCFTCFRYERCPSKSVRRKPCHAITYQCKISRARLRDSSGSCHRKIWCNLSWFACRKRCKKGSLNLFTWVICVVFLPLHAAFVRPKWKPGESWDNTEPLRLRPCPEVYEQLGKNSTLVVSCCFSCCRCVNCQASRIINQACKKHHIFMIQKVSLCLNNAWHRGNLWTHIWASGSTVLARTWCLDGGWKGPMGWLIYSWQSCCPQQRLLSLCGTQVLFVL